MERTSWDILTQELFQSRPRGETIERMDYEMAVAGDVSSDRIHGGKWSGIGHGGITGG